jgi:hypothetical protein
MTEMDEMRGDLRVRTHSATKLSIHFVPLLLCSTTPDSAAPETTGGSTRLAPGMYRTMLVVTEECMEAFAAAAEVKPLLCCWVFCRMTLETLVIWDEK